MDLYPTLIVLALAAAAFAAANWHQRRERMPGDVTLIPHTMIQILAVVICLVMLAHLVTLATGHPFKGRFAN